MNTLKIYAVLVALTCTAAGSQASTRSGERGIAAEPVLPQRCAIGHEAPHAAKPQHVATRKLRTRADTKNPRQSCLLFRKQLPAEDLKSEDTMANTAIHHPHADTPL